MLEIIGIVWLGITIRKMLNAKGMNSTKYVLIMVALWVGLEIIMAFVGILIFENELAAIPFALIGAICGGYLGYRIAKNAVEQSVTDPEILDANI